MKNVAMSLVAKESDAGRLDLGRGRGRDDGNNGEDDEARKPEDEEEPNRDAEDDVATAADDDEDDEVGEEEEEEEEEEAGDETRASSADRMSKLFPGRKVAGRFGTDVHFLLVFVAMAVLWAYLGIWGLVRADLNQLTSPTDTDGNICGVGRMARRPNILFYNLLSCAHSFPEAKTCMTKQICVADCPQINYSPLLEAGAENVSREIFDVVHNFCEEGVDWRLSPRELVERSICPPWVVISSPVLKRCLPMILYEHKENANSKTKFTTTTTTKGPRWGPQGLDRSAAAHAQSDETYGDVYRGVRYRDPLRVFNVTQDQVYAANFDNSTVTKEALLFAAQVAHHQLGVKDLASKLVFDLYEDRGLFLECAAFVTALALVWVVLLSWFAPFVVWGTVVTLATCFALSSAFCYNRYKDLRHSGLDFKFDLFYNASLSEFFAILYRLKDTWIFLGVVFSSLFTFSVVMTFFKRKRIVVAAKIIEMTSHTMIEVWPVIALPVIFIVLTTLSFEWFSLTAVLVSTAGRSKFIMHAFECPGDVGNVTCSDRNGGDLRVFDECHRDSFACPGCPRASCNFDQYVATGETFAYQVLNVTVLVLYLLWFSAQTQLAVASVFALWFWEVGHGLARMMARALRFTLGHLGTTAKGSVLIPLCFVPGYLLDWVNEVRARKHKKDCQRLLLFLFKPCMMAYDNCLAYISRYAYLVAAMDGQDFCNAGKIAFKLQEKKKTNVAVLTRQINFIFFFSKVTIVYAAVVLAYLIMESMTHYQHSVIGHLNYFYTPLGLVLAISYFVAELVLETYECGVESLCFCFVQDKELNRGDADNPYFMTEEMFKVLGKYMRPRHVQREDKALKAKRQAQRKAAYLSTKTSKNRSSSTTSL